MHTVVATDEFDEHIAHSTTARIVKRRRVGAGMGMDVVMGIGTGIHIGIW